MDEPVYLQLCRQYPELATIPRDDLLPFLLTKVLEDLKALANARPAAA